MPYMASADVYSILEVLARDELSERLRDRLGDGGRQLEDLKIACYYGCALVRPPEITNFDDPENPQSMETLLRLGGAQTIDWAFKTECCGASHQITTPRTGRDLLERIFADAAANGANAIATACPLCMLNLDMREAEINRGRLARGEQPFDIPVYYFTEILGLALGGAPEQLGLNRHFWPVRVHDASASAGAGVDTGTVHLSAAESEAVA
jgi:heterodisulfide reductase subunit B